MAVKFTKGDSIATTRKLVAHNPPPSAHPRSKSPRGGNSIGMPGYITAHERENMGGAKGGKGFGPAREQDIGERGGSGAKGMGSAKKAPGTAIRNYRSASTGRAGAIRDPNDTGAHHVHTANRKGGSPAGGKAPPSARGRVPGGGRASGIGNSKEGGAGRMEHLRGRTEGKRKSMMY
jgi:hypothetical protein